MMCKRPNSQLGTITDAQFVKDPIQILLHGSFAEMQVVRNLFIEFCLCDQVDHLLFSKAEFLVEAFFSLFRQSARRTDSASAVVSELASASAAASQ